MDKIIRKSLLYKSQVEYGDFCINHVEGCAHGCKFPCYAMLLKKRCGVIRDYQDWLKPKLVSNSIELLRAELPRYLSHINRVHLCFSTDPFMLGFSEVHDLSIRIIEELNNHDIKAVVLTKGILPTTLANRDRPEKNEFGITLVSLDENFRNEYEPYSASYSERISSLRQLHQSGLKTWVSIEPYPTPNIMEQNLLAILEEIAFVDKIVFGRMNYNPLVLQYRDYRSFYEECACQVLAFCRKLNIDVHIKRGTSRVYDENVKLPASQNGEGKKGPSTEHRPTLFE